MLVVVWLESVFVTVVTNNSHCAVLDVSVCGKFEFTFVAENISLVVIVVLVCVDSVLSIVGIDNVVNPSVALLGCVESLIFCVVTDVSLPVVIAVLVCVDSEFPSVVIENFFPNILVVFGCVESVLFVFESV